MKIAVLQQNYTVGDLEGNAGKIMSGVKSLPSGLDLALTTELSLLGYPPRDLLLNHNFIKKAGLKLKEIASELSAGPPVLIGTAVPSKSGTGKPLYNCAVLVSKGKIIKIWKKTLIPSYDVFDEERYFESDQNQSVIILDNKIIGVTICEDIWNNDKTTRIHYDIDPLNLLVKKGVNLIINISASPFVIGKQFIREKLLSGIAVKYRLPVIYANQVGGNDDLVFDGRSCAFDSKGSLVTRAKAFEEDFLIVDLNTVIPTDPAERGSGRIFSTELNKKDSSTALGMTSIVNRISPDDFTAESETYRALVLGTRDYVIKCGFNKTIIGLSGGIDSSLTAVIATHALGKENVLGVLMPSRYSSAGSKADALALAQNLGIKTIEIPINEIFNKYLETLKDAFKEYQEDVTEENIQARIRGNLLMALSNKYEAMVLSTGNKSELAVGYCTIYGDMAGGFAVLSDVPKTLVYKLAKWINRETELIPQNIIAKAPSAELKPNQKDQDILPPYEVLDEILNRSIERHYSIEQVVRDGFNKNTVEKVYKMVGKAEYKRKQAPPGIKITDRAFGTGWRIPIAKK